MRKGAVLSGLMHVAVVLIAYFGLPSLFSPPEIQQAIPVEVVTVAEVTTPPKVEEAPEPTPPPPEPPKPEPPKPEPPKPEPPKPVAEQPPPLLPPPPPEPEPEPVPLPTLAPPEPAPQVAKAEPKPPPPKKPKLPEKPAEKAPDKPAEPDFASVLRNVEKLKQQAPKQPTPETTPQPEATPRSLVDQPLTMSEKDAIRRQIERCWNVPAGARDAEDLVVEIRVRLNPDGSVFQAEILDIDRMARDGFFRAAAESARRAVMLCSPLKMPARNYNDWKVITLVFNPKEMFGT